MKSKGKTVPPPVPDRPSRSAPAEEEGVWGLAARSGREILNRILEAEQPVRVVQAMARVDFYWLVKRIGEEDALALIELASQEQWEHILDMELWVKDRLDPSQAAAWLDRFQRANPAKLVGWLYGEGELFCHHFLFQSIQVEVRRGEELLDLGDGFFTLDNLCWIKVLDKEQEEWITSLLRQMAARDYQRFQALLLNLAGVLPAETEEELYRLRNVRLAEDGFLPFEEAVSLYAYLKDDAFLAEPPLPPLQASPEGDGPPLVPMLPLLHVEGRSLLARTMETVQDPSFLDRLRLEFAGLCNQILSADLTPVNDMQVLLRACRKAAGYLNLGLERFAGAGPASAERLLREHPLVSLFQAGFGLTLELRWEAERRVREAWFARAGLSAGFWGDAWGGLLLGVLRKRPLYYAGCGEEEARPFERWSEVEDSRGVLEKIFVLDRFLETLTAGKPLRSFGGEDPLVTYHAFIITFWARGELGLSQGFEPLTVEEVRDLFHRIRGDESDAPFRMGAASERFLNDLMDCAEGLDVGTREVLRKALAGLWEEFREEYAWVAAPDLDERFTRFLLIRGTVRFGSPAP